MQLQENQDEIENMMNSIFKGIFVHRYRYTFCWTVEVHVIIAICYLFLGGNAVGCSDDLAFTKYEFLMFLNLILYFPQIVVIVNILVKKY